MKVLFDYQAFEIQSFGGVSHSYAELISHLQKEGVDCNIGLKESDNVHVKECGLAPNRKVMGTIGYHDDFLSINQDYCIKLLKRQKFDIFEPTYFDSYYLPYLKGKPFVLTVHDMIPEILGVDEPQAKQKKLLCPLAAHIHVPSENTKNDLVDILSIPPERVTVTPHGVPALPSTLYTSHYSFPYILYVGARWSYKNFPRFIEECAIIIKRHPELYVVCTGQVFDEEEQRLISSLGLSEHIIHQYATEQEMQSLYQNAVAFIYPSAYEGFGMPILEAFACGCPVMLNNTSCFPEVGGDAAVYFDINRHGDLAERLIALYQASSEKRDELIAKGKARLSIFSWEESARKLKQIYDSIL